MTKIYLIHIRFCFGYVLFFRHKVKLSKSSRYRSRKRAAILTASIYSSSSSDIDDNESQIFPIPSLRPVQNTIIN